jgi:hypothetical protein
MMRRRIRATWLAGAAAITSCVLWAAAPLGESNQPNGAVVVAAPSSKLVKATPKPIEPQAFTARLWNPRPAEQASQVAQQEVAARSATMRLQLIGIINEGGQLKAALYDPQTDRVLIVTSGDRVGQHTITRISASTVELSDGRFTSRLKLREDCS